MPIRPVGTRKAWPFEIATARPVNFKVEISTVLSQSNPAEHDEDEGKDESALMLCAACTWQALIRVSVSLRSGISVARYIAAKATSLVPAVSLFGRRHHCLIATSQRRSTGVERESCHSRVCCNNGMLAASGNASRHFHAKHASGLCRQITGSGARSQVFRFEPGGRGGRRRRATNRQPTSRMIFPVVLPVSIAVCASAAASNA